MDIFRSLQYPARNPGWFGKLMIWSVLLLGIVTTPLAVGYFVRLVRNVARGNEFLPSYADKKQLYWDGLRCLGARLVFSLPLLIVFGSIIVACAMLDDNTPFANFMSQMSMRVFVSMFRSLYLMVIVFVMPLSTLCVAYSSDWYAGINFSLMGKLVRDNVLNYVLTVLVCYAIFSMSGFGLLVMIVGILFTVPYVSFSVAHLYGSFLRERLLSYGEENLPE